MIGARDVEIALTHGDVPIRLEYFNKDLDKPQLEVSWSGPNFEKQSLSTNATVNFDKLLKTHAELIETNAPLKTLVNQQEELKKQRDQRRRQRVPYEHQALAVSEGEADTPDATSLRRGNPHLVGREVKPAFPEVLNPSTVEVPPVPEDAKSSGKRRVFAEWVASAKNPLTARVIVNRIWQHHFGRGIVRSTNDFGQFGTPPTHPELLDWLASEFIASGWRLKAMHKLIMTSNAYRMSVQSNLKFMQQDPNNDFFWRFDMRRLTAEEIRDTVLWITGKLNLKMGGARVFFLNYRKKYWQHPQDQGVFGGNHHRRRRTDAVFM